MPGPCLIALRELLQTTSDQQAIAIELNDVIVEWHIVFLEIFLIKCKLCVDQAEALYIVFLVTDLDMVYINYNNLWIEGVKGGSHPGFPDLKWPIPISQP